MRALTAGLIITLVGPLPASAQHEDHQPSPYAGQELSEIPALTAQELEDLRTAAGMGLARPAELNHYPGPRHVLDMAEALRLSQDQRARIKTIRQAMSAEALQVGEEIIEAERALNTEFGSGGIDEVALEAALGQIASLYGELRFAHLRAHLATTRVLVPAQVREYDRLRGYAANN